MKKGIGKFTTILLFCTFFQVQTYAFDVTVGLFNDFSVQASVYTVISGSVVLSDAHRLTKELHQGDLLYFSCWGDSVHVRAIDGWGGTFKHVDLHADPLFSIRPVYPAFEPRFYEGDLEVFFSLNRLQLNNIVDSEIYLAGVVESEGGNKAADAFYQAQAILARTYLMKNLHRHAEEGFQVCDGVHCQAFKGINQNAVQIMAACRLTKGLVVTDQEGKLISAFFHSNCGGETATGESVWLARQSYLSSVQDQFCSQGRNFTWHKNIPLKEWINYIKNIYPSFSVKSNDQLNFSSI